jgi:hypothetical protein
MSTQSHELNRQWMKDTKAANLASPALATYVQFKVGLHESLDKAWTSFSFICGRTELRSQFMTDSLRRNCWNIKLDDDNFNGFELMSRFSTFVKARLYCGLRF